jgi:Mlc titration factor MtfA (ptsG expression regulator)
VVVHEFAHQLDQETGQANGAPQLGARADRSRWLKTFTAEFALLQQRTEVARADPAGPDDSLLSDYGATSPAEFFAVASEVFFERPQRMSLEHATLYEEMRRFYCVDPLSW